MVNMTQQIVKIGHEKIPTIQDSQDEKKKLMIVLKWKTYESTVNHELNILPSENSSTMNYGTTQQRSTTNIPSTLTLWRHPTRQSTVNNTHSKWFKHLNCKSTCTFTINCFMYILKVTEILQKTWSAEQWSTVG